MTCEPKHAELYVRGSHITDGQTRNLILSLRKGQMVTVHYHRKVLECGIKCKTYQTEDELHTQ